jgi:hypothetical protein
MKTLAKLALGVFAVLSGGGVQQAAAQQAYYIQSLYEAKRTNTPKVIDVPWAMTTPVWVQQYACNGQANQKWVPEYEGYRNGRHWYRFRNVNSWLYLTMTNQQNGSAITQEWHYGWWGDYTRQLWSYEFRAYYGGTAAYALLNGYAPTKSLNREGPTTANNAVLRIWTDYRQENQSWIFIPAN